MLKRPVVVKMVVMTRKSLKRAVMKQWKMMLKNKK